MRAQVRSAGVCGVEAYGVEVDIDVTSAGLPAYQVIGLPVHMVKESAVRVRAALASSGFQIPPRIIIHVNPVDIRKDGAAFDLPIAVGILSAMELIPRPLDGFVLLGELALDGSLRRVTGALPVAMHARTIGACGLILPRECASEAAAVTRLPIYAADTLLEVVAFLRGEGVLPQAERIEQVGVDADLDLAEVRGLETARRALEVAAAGGHNLLLLGPPGSGKSLLARCLSTILPPLDEKEALETTAIYSAAGKLDGASLLTWRPFRAPHHDISVAGLVGGGPLPRPGEISLAHHGVLFLDELAEFKRPVLEALRQPLEDRRVTIVRARAALSYPASFSLVGAMNPCPCGYRGSSLRSCTCSDDRVRRYLERVAFLAERMDLCVEMPHVDYRTLRDARKNESSAAVRKRVMAARAIQQRRRYANAEMGPRQLREHCRLDVAADGHLETCVRRFGLSGRAIHRILRVARTVADLAGRERLVSSDVAEAIAFCRWNQAFRQDG